MAATWFGLLVLLSAFPGKDEDRKKDTSKYLLVLENLVCDYSFLMRKKC